MNKIPQKININGDVLVTDNYLLIEKNNATHEVSMATLVIELQVNSTVNDVDITFKSKISHKFIDRELQDIIAQLAIDCERELTLADK